MLGLAGLACPWCCVCGPACAFLRSQGLAQAQAFGGSRASRAAAEGDQKMALIAVYLACGLWKSLDFEQLAANRLGSPFFCVRGLARGSCASKNMPECVLRSRWGHLGASLARSWGPLGNLREGPENLPRPPQDGLRLAHVLRPPLQPKCVAFHWLYNKTRKPV